MSESKSPLLVTEWDHGKSAKVVLGSFILLDENTLSIKIQYHGRFRTFLIDLDTLSPFHIVHDASSNVGVDIVARGDMQRYYFNQWESVDHKGKAGHTIERWGCRSLPTNCAFVLYDNDDSLFIVYPPEGEEYRFLWEQPTLAGKPGDLQCLSSRHSSKILMVASWNEFSEEKAKLQRIFLFDVKEAFEKAKPVQNKTKRRKKQGIPFTEIKDEHLQGCNVVAITDLFIFTNMGVIDIQAPHHPFLPLPKLDVRLGVAYASQALLVQKHYASKKAPGVSAYGNENVEEIQVFGVQVKNSIASCTVMLHLENLVGRLLYFQTYVAESEPVCVISLKGPWESWCVSMNSIKHVPNNETVVWHPRKSKIVSLQGGSISGLFLQAEILESRK